MNICFDIHRICINYLSFSLEKYLLEKLSRGGPSLNRFSGYLSSQLGNICLETEFVKLQFLYIMFC